MDKRTILRRFTIAGFVGFTLVVVAMFIRQGWIASESRNLVEHTYSVREQIDRVFLRVKDVELGQRGFSLTGDTVYLDPYYNALHRDSGTQDSSGKKSIHDEIRLLRIMVSDNASQTARAATLEELVEARIRFADSIIEIRRQFGLDSVVVAMKHGTGKRLMTTTRAVVDEMFRQEEVLLAERLRVDASRQWTNALLLYFVVGLFYVAWLISLRIAGRNRRRRVNAERDLRASHNLLQATIHSGSHAIFSTDMSGKILLFNHAAEEMLGYAAKEVVGRPATDALAGVHDRAQIERRRKRLEERLGRSVRGLELFTAPPGPDDPPDPEWSMTPKRGEPFLASIVVSPMMGNDGTQHGYLFTARNITERRMMERRLVETNAMMNALIASSRYAILACDANGIVTVVNNAAETMLGCRAEDYLGELATTMMGDILVEEEVNARTKRVMEVHGQVPDGVEVFTMPLPEDPPFGQSWTLVRRDGSRFPSIMSVAAMRDTHGGPLGVVALANDVTELKQLEHGLMESNLLLNAVIHGIDYAVFVADTQGIIRIFSRGAERMLGYRAEDFIGKQIVEATAKVFLPEELAARAERVIAHRGRPPEGAEIFNIPLPDDGPLGQEWTNVCADGTHINVAVSAWDLRSDDGVLQGTVAIARDITALQANERMKKEFISTVSHELRTPLTSIRGALGLIAGGAAGTLPDGAREMITIAHRNSERLVRIINDILDIDKIDTGNLNLYPSVLNVAEFLRQAVEANLSYGEKHAVTFEIGSMPDDVEMVADPDRLMQVMANLLSNAAKFSLPESTVSIHAERNGSHIRIAVQDRGQGIPDVFRARVFEKFAQAEGADSRRFEGTGLGLNITKKLVEAMGGSIGFSTEMDKGTTFFFEMPLFTAVESGQGGGKGTERPRIEVNAPRVLICEDDPDVGTLLRVLLEREGLATDIVATLAEARLRLKTNHYAALTLDLLLPDGSGLTLLRDLRKDAATRELPVIVISARADEGRRELNGDAIGMIDWIAKPIDEVQLQSSVSRALSGSAMDKPSVLHVEDDADFRRVLAHTLGDAAEWFGASTLTEAEGLLKKMRFNLVILDLDLPDGSGLALLERLKTYPGGPVPVLILSASETDNGVRQKVESVLVKSRLSEERIVATILAQIRKTGTSADTAT